MNTPGVMRGGTMLMLFLCMTCLAPPAFADIDSVGILDNVLNRYSAAASAWGSIVTGRASWLFWTLTAISMVWTFGMLAMRKADMGEFFAEFVRFTVFTGFFWWLLSNGPRFAVSIIDSLRQIGAEATGIGGGKLAPSGVVDIGFDIFSKVIAQSSISSPVDSACGIAMGAIVLVVFALVGVNMLLLLISSWILAYAGVFFLGFGGSRWTSEMAIGYFKTVLNIAAQLFTMVLLVGIGRSFVDQYYAAMSAGISLNELGVMLVVAVVLLALIRTIPGLIGGLAGGNTGSLGSGFGAGAAFGAVAMGTAAAATAGAAVVAGATSMAGGAQAVMAAYSKASAAETNGGGAQTALADAASAANAVASNSSGGSSPLADAMGDAGDGSANTDFRQATRSPDSGDAAKEDSQGTGSADTSRSGTAGNKTSSIGTAQGVPAAGLAASKAGRIAAGTVAHLARGTWEVAKSKASITMDTAIDRISKTTGGQIATAINDYVPQSKSQDEPEAFGDDTLAKGDAAMDPEDEVAAFRDRRS